MAVIITLAMVLLVASAALAVTGTGRRGKGAPERDDRNRADAVRVPTPAVRVPEEPARPHQGFRVAGVRHTAWSPTGGPGPGHPAGPPLIAPLAGRRLAGQ